MLRCSRHLMGSVPCWISCVAIAIMGQLAVATYVLLFAGPFPSPPSAKLIQERPTLAVDYRPGVLSDRFVVRPAVVIRLDPTIDVGQFWGKSIFFENEFEPISLATLPGSLGIELRAVGSDTQFHAGPPGRRDLLQRMDILDLGYPFRFVLLRSMEGRESPERVYGAVKVHVPAWLMARINPPWYDVYLPTMIRPFPLLANLAMFTAAAWIGILACIGLRGAIRLRRGRCWRCAYPTSDKVCSECGEIALARPGAEDE